MAKSRPSHLNTDPVKNFFVDMLTRDIELDDAILDLLDNCLDGAVRSIGKRGLDRPNPYEGFHADITLKRGRFVIEDNCGGISSDRQEYAFQMGRPPVGKDNRLPTVGAYGIGMKRAIFKLGRNATIETRAHDIAYTVKFGAAWFQNENNWLVPVEYDLVGFKEPGTKITVTSLTLGAQKLLADSTFVRTLRDKIATYYAFVISKGFKIRVNGDEVEGKPIRLRFSEDIRPYIFEIEKGPVQVFMAVGFTQPIPDVDEAADDGQAGSGGKYRKMDAGWTIVCNDRVVIHCDKTEVTGWGEADVPRYHNQFISISGIVEFRSDDATLLPTTTTKRGIDGSSVLYLRVKNQMREGLKLFTTYTNRWKGHEVAREGKKLIERAAPLTFAELKTSSQDLPMAKVARIENARQFRPKLPMPKARQDPLINIQFKRLRQEVEEVGMYLLGDRKASGSRVGEAAFEAALELAEE